MTGTGREGGGGSLGRILRRGNYTFLESFLLLKFALSGGGVDGAFFILGHFV